MSFVHLHCHNEYSLLDGLGTAEQWAIKAKELGHEAIAITNHGNVDGLIKLQNECEKAGIVAIHGCELYIVEGALQKVKGERRKHITVWVKNNEGWRNLLQMLTFANADGFYYRPRITPEILLKHNEGLIIGTACCETFVLSPWGKKLFHVLMEEKKDDLYFEVMPYVDFKPQEKVNKLALRYHKEYGIKLLATNDCHYPEKRDSFIQEVLLAIQTKKRWNDKDRWKFDLDDLYLKSEQEMKNGFKKQGILNQKQIDGAIENSMEIFEKCKDFKIEKKQVSLPSIKVDGKIISDDAEEKFLKDLCEKGLDLKVSKNKIDILKIQEYKDRLEEELEIIIRQDFVKYFLIVWELIDWCKKNDILTGWGRGSSGGSLVCYLIGITGVDPLRFGLLFARFISPARIDLPDIDMDFEDIKRPMVRKHLEELYGEGKVAGTSTFLTMKGRGAIRDVSRVFNVPLKEVGKATNSIVVRSGGDARSNYSIEDAFETFEDGIRFKKKYPEVTMAAMRLEGQVRGKGQHAAAMIISDDEFKDGLRACLVRGKNNETIVNWDKYDIEHVGLMKLDVLGLNALTVLAAAAKEIKKNKGIDIVWEDVELDDPKVFQEYSKGNTVGCFQFGSLGLRKLCVEMGIDNFTTLTHANALYRPGTLRSGMVTEFIERREGKKFKYLHPYLEELTGDTYGIILYQEQVMRFMYELGGLGWKTADTVRKVISKSQGVEQFQKFKKDFVDGCEKKKTLDRKSAEKLWNELSSFGSYGFNLSHAVEYSVIAYLDMWCKIYHPAEFICASLTYGSEQKKEDLIAEAIRLGLDVRPPKIGISTANIWIIKDNILYCPFIEIKGFGEKTAVYAEKENTKGFFNGAKTELPERFKKKLDEIQAQKDFSVTNEYADSIEEYFKFSFNRDPYKKFEGIMKKISQSVQVEDISSIDFAKTDTKDRYYFGRMTEIKFGYKQNVNKGKGTSMGGVYGNFEDKTDYCMMIFDSKIYNRRKYDVEHCGDQFLISRSTRPNRAQSILCNNVWFDKDLLKGDLGGLKLDLIKSKRFINKELSSCEKCELRETCTAPVLPSKGQYNVMIIGEAPWTQEDKIGRGFVGKTGAEFLWPEMKRYDLSRIMFHITNVVKCKVKPPKAKHIKTCSIWLDEEIKKINPPLILAFGNTTLKYFLDQDSGIMEKSGTTEWVEKAQAWVCWCIHPSSVMYSPENKKMFKEGIKNFANKLKIFGEIEKS